jgi:hypothetical protein
MSERIIIILVGTVLLVVLSWFFDYPITLDDNPHDDIQP